ncbi:MAG: hypothetical protein AAGA18_15565 [Verrucomicrobiota bacterium]
MVTALRTVEGLRAFLFEARAHQEFPLLLGNLATKLVDGMLFATGIKPSKCLRSSAQLFYFKPKEKHFKGVDLLIEPETFKLKNCIEMRRLMS